MKANLVRAIDAIAETFRQHTSSIIAIYVVLFVVVGIATLPNYGLTWDEGLGDLFFGERYLHFFLTLDPAYLDFDNANLPIHQYPFNLYLSPYRNTANEFPPVANILSAATMEVFSRRLGWLDPVDAFHLAKVLMAGAFLWILFQFAAPRFGNFAAGLAVLMLGTYPRFWGDMHFNPKDIPETVFFALTIFAFVIWSERPSWKRAALVGLGMGCALGIKGNALFIPIILVLGFFPLQSPPRLWSSGIEHLRKYLGQYIVMVVVAVFVHFITWPLLYADPMRLFDYYSYIFTEGYLKGAAGWNWDPLIQTVTTMPEIELLLLIFTIPIAIWNWSKTKSPLMRLLLVWLVVPILRTSLPGSANFDGIRHFEEFVPAACLLASFGGASLVNFSARFTERKTMVATVLVALIVFNIGWIEARYYPYEHLYFNSLVGGLRGAQQQLPDVTDYWGSSYRQGIHWLNDNAERDAVLHVAIAPWIVKIPAAIWLRSDITLVEESAVKRQVEKGNPVYVMFFTRTGWYNSIATYAAQKLKPVYQITIDGATILVIYKLDDARGLPN